MHDVLTTVVSPLTNAPTGGPPSGLPPGDGSHVDTGGAVGALVLRFLVVGALAFGGGQAALPVLDRLTVAETGWLSARDFATGIGLAYATPGPVLIIAAFVGYRVAGVGGALAATAAVFAVPVLAAIVMARLVARLTGSVRIGPRVRAFGRYAGAAAIGLLVVTLTSVVRPLVAIDPRLVIAAAGVGLLADRRVSAPALLVVAAVIGAIVMGVRTA